MGQYKSRYIKMCPYHFFIIPDIFSFVPKNSIKKELISGGVQLTAEYPN